MPNVKAEIGVILPLVVKIVLHICLIRLIGLSCSFENQFGETMPAIRDFQA